MIKRLLTLIVFCAIVATAFYVSPLRFPVRQLYPIRGIDVSHHQKKINWEKVADQNVQFVWIKASEGGNFKDTQFSKNWSAAKKVGIPRGAYHFLTFCRSGREQAKNFINAVGSFNSSDLIPALDIEYGGNCKDRLSQKEMEKLVSDFTSELRKVSKNPPILYVTRDIYEEYFADSSLKNKLWVRAIIASPSRSYRSDWSIWQYNHRGRVAGIEGPVDFNVIKGKSLDSLFNR